MSSFMHRVTVTSPIAAGTASVQSEGFAGVRLSKSAGLQRTSSNSKSKWNQEAFEVGGTQLATDTVVQGKSPRKHATISELPHITVTLPAAARGRPAVTASTHGNVRASAAAPDAGGAHAAVMPG